MASSNFTPTEKQRYEQQGFVENVVGFWFNCWRHLCIYLLPEYGIAAIWRSDIFVPFRLGLVLRDL